MAAILVAGRHQASFDYVVGVGRWNLRDDDPFGIAAFNCGSSCRARSLLEPG